MPHHESGLLALKTNDPKVIDRVLAPFLEDEPHHDVGLVRVAGGKGVLLTFSSVMHEGQHVDLSAFQDEKWLRHVAKVLRVPIHVGFAIGGYSNSQQALAISNEGKVLWRSSYGFEVPEAMRDEYGDPFTDDGVRHALTLRARNENGYGLIGSEFGFDYLKVLDINVGDPLLARDKRTLGPKGATEHAKWLKAKFRSPETTKEVDEAAPADQVERVGFRVLKKGALPPLAAVITRLATHRGTPLKDLLLEGKGAADTVAVLSGRGVAPLSPTLLSEPFVHLLTSVCQAGVMVFEWPKRQAPQLRRATSTGNPLALMRAQREPLVTSGLKPVKLEAGAALVKRIDALRKAAVAALDDDDDWDDDE